MSDETKTPSEQPQHELILTSYQRKLIEQWKQTHGDEPPPLIPNDNNTAIWVNNKQRRILKAQARKAARK